jgi:hypothetical protein
MVMLVLMRTNNLTDCLEALGFNATEAVLLCELVRSGPSTGYRLAHATGKSAANVYGALASLAQKGAVLADDAEPRTFRAIAPEELLNPVRERLEGLLDEAQTALQAMHAPQDDDRIYQLKTVAQVYERARAMLDGASQIVLFDLFPQPFEALRPHLAAAAERRTVVAGTVYADPGETGFPALVSEGAGFVAARWPGLQITLAVDAREFLVALLSADGGSVKRAIWSDSAYLACLQHSGLSAEIRMAARTPQQAASLAGISLLKSFPDGLRRLVGAPEPGRSYPEVA